MLSSFKNFFRQNKVTQDNSTDDLQLLCGLMIEAANIDGNIDELEIKKISSFLIENFHEESSLVEEQIKKSLEELNENKSLHYFTSKINKSFSKEKKIILIKMLWEIILVDNNLHDFESNLIRRLAGLLYISDYDCGKAKKDVLEKMENGNN